MIQKKICMLGSFSVGKTSLVKQYVESIFSEKYHTTLGVKIDKKQISVQGQDMTLVLWDIAGEDDYFKVKPVHMRGMSGAIIVIDGTRSNTFDVAMSLYNMVRALPAGDNIPVIFALNKVDLKPEWLLTEEVMLVLKKTGSDVVETSAKNNCGVDELFSLLSGQLLPVEAKH
uniref:Small GTP-binding protein domain n=1 Tax=uncultured Thiotrichaceae bacterium TaxID=298394 RepID=A0A6S6UBX7_9GAMM|nr:MAG: Small GTP-binding protein domain [uncultured Thiotrichaceae bacterium]